MAERGARMNGGPVVSHEHPIPEPFGGAKLNGTCVDSAYVLTDHDDCDVCLMVDQCSIPGTGRHALMRMDTAEARALGEALIGASASPEPGLERVIEELEKKADWHEKCAQTLHAEGRGEHSGGDEAAAVATHECLQLLRERSTQPPEQAGGKG